MHAYRLPAPRAPRADNALRSALLAFTFALALPALAALVHLHRGRRARARVRALTGAAPEPHLQRAHVVLDLVYDLLRLHERGCRVEQGLELRAVLARRHHEARVRDAELRERLRDFGRERGLRHRQPERAQVHGLVRSLRCGGGRRRRVHARDAVQGVWGR